MTTTAVNTARIGSADQARDLEERSIRRRITWIWLLLLFNTMPWIGVPTLIAIPQRVGQVLAAGALGLALVLAVTLNRPPAIRPSVILFLFTVLLAIGCVAGVRGTAGLGGFLRAGRFAAFLAVLWLLTPWWGRRDMLLARCHLKGILLILATVVAGLAIAPSVALGGPDGRLSGALWPMWPVAVAHFAALGAGMGVVLWLSGSLAGRRALVLSVGGLALLVLSHTRVAMVSLAAGLLCATVSLFFSRRRARRTVTVALVVVPLVAVALAPAISSWFTRGQSGEQLRGLTGRTEVWSDVLKEPRSELTQWIGSGLSDKGFFGRPIDNSWIAIYQDQGLVGVAVAGTIVLLLLLAPAFRPPGPARALALFIVVYCAVASYTEVGLGDASSYLLDLVVAASLVTPSDAHDGAGWE